MKLRNATLAVLLAGLGVASAQAGEFDSAVRHEARNRSWVRTGASLRRGTGERLELRRFRHPQTPALLSQDGRRAARTPVYFAVQPPSRWQRHLADVQPPAA